LPPITSGETAKTKVLEISPRNLHREMRRISRNLIIGIDRKEFQFTANNRSIPLGSLDVLRILTHYRSDSEIEKLACSLLLREAYLCEKKQPLGSYAFINSIADSGVNQSPTQCDRKIIEKMFDHLGERTLSKSILFGLESCGHRGQVYIEENASEQTHVRLRGRSEFPIVSLPEFGTKLTLADCAVACVDGVIENVSEIHHILEEHYRTKSELVLLCRGMSTEVASVLVQNWRMGHLRVIPVTGRPDWTQEFVIRDIADCFGDSPVVHFREKKIELLQRKSVEIEGGFIRFESTQSIDDPVEMDSSMIEFHETRKKWHSGRNVTIVLGGDLGDYRGILKDRISTLIRFIKFSKTNKILRLQQSWCPIEASKVAKESSDSLMSESLRIRAGVLKDEGLVQA